MSGWVPLLLAMASNLLYLRWPPPNSILESMSQSTIYIGHSRCRVLQPMRHGLVSFDMFCPCFEWPVLFPSPHSKEYIEDTWSVLSIRCSRGWRTTHDSNSQGVVGACVFLRPTKTGFDASMCSACKSPGPNNEWGSDCLRVVGVVMLLGLARRARRSRKKSLAPSWSLPQSDAKPESQRNIMPQIVLVCSCIVWRSVRISVEC